MKTVYIIISFLCLMGWSACSDDWGQDTGNGNGNKERKVHVTATFPSENVVKVSSRNTTEVNKDRISNVTFLLFDPAADGTLDDATFFQSTSASYVSQEGTQQVGFDILIPTDKPMVIHAVANYTLPENFDNDNSGKKAGELIPSLLDGINPNEREASSNGEKKLLFWGCRNITQALGENGTIENFVMIRNVAKFTVDNTLTKDVFKIKSIYACNTLNKGTIAPYPTITDDKIETDLENVTTATEPAQSTDGLAKADWEVAATEGSDQTSIYTFPRRNLTGKQTEGADGTVTNGPLDRDDRLYLIIEGIYSGAGTEVDGFYRVEIAQKEDPKGTNGTLDGTEELNYFEIMRNRNYVVTLKEVSGPGYLTMDEAKAAPASNNINLTVNSVVNDDVLDVLSNGQYKLGMTNREYFLYKQPETAGWIDISRIYLEYLLPDGTDGTLPTLNNLEVSIVEGSNVAGLIDTNQGNGGIQITSGTSETGKDYRQISVYCNSYTEGMEAMQAQLLVKLGNIYRVITIYQSDTMEFGELSTFYVAWRKGEELTIPVVIPQGTIIPTLGLTVRVNCTDAENQFLGYDAAGGDAYETSFTCFTPGTYNVTLKTTQAYYGHSTTGNYREQKVTIAAEGFNTKEAIVKQSRYLDGVYGNGIIGIYCSNDQSEVVPVDFGDSEQAWTAKVTSGADWIKLGASGSTAPSSSQVSGKDGNLSFCYQIEPNTNTSTDRYGVIKITYAITCTHYIFVHQGYNDVTVGGVQWAARNCDGDGQRGYGYFAESPAHPGSFYHRGNREVYYDGITPSWGEDVSNWNSTGGQNGQKDWTTDTPCPEGYRLPTYAEYNNAFEFEISGTSTGSTEVSDKDFNRALWGRISDGTTGSLDNTRPGLYLLNFDDQDETISLAYFIPACGVRSQGYKTKTGVFGNGKLLYGWYGSEHYGAQGGSYWLQNYQAIYNETSQKAFATDIYHDPSDNIGTKALASGGIDALGISVNDAMPVRCVRINNN